MGLNAPATLHALLVFSDCGTQFFLDRDAACDVVTVIVEAQQDSLQLEAPLQPVLAILLLADADLACAAVLIARHFQLGVDGGTDA